MFWHELSHTQFSFIYLFSGIKGHTEESKRKDEDERRPHAMSLRLKAPHNHKKSKAQKDEKKNIGRGRLNG